MRTFPSSSWTREVRYKSGTEKLKLFHLRTKGLEFEQARQEKLLSGGIIQQETRRYDEATKKTILMRVKEGSDDYRYFPEPDLVELYIDDEWKEAVRASIPELPDARKARYVAELGLPAYDAHVLTLTKCLISLKQLLQTVLMRN